MNLPQGKPDVVELARAQLDFAAMNTGAPTTKDILLKAQTIVPMAPQVQWEKYGAAAGAGLILCAVLLLPWVPQRNLVSLAGAHFEARLDPAQAQAIVNGVVNALRTPGSEALLSADYSTQPGGGMLTLRATGFSESGAALSHRLEQALSGLPEAVPVTTYQIAEHRHNYRVSPMALARRQIAALTSDKPGEVHPAAELAARARQSEAVLRVELGSELRRHGFELTGFAFAADGALLPAGCQFKLPAWPQPVAIGVRGYLKLSGYQQSEVQQLAAVWLAGMNLTGSGLLLEEQAATQPVVAQVFDQAGRLDSLLTARLNAAIEQPTPLQLAGSASGVEQAVARAASTVLPGIERRVEFERLSRRGELGRYRVRITLLGRADPELPRPADPVDDSSVREEW